MENVKGLKKLIKLLEKLPPELENDLAAVLEANAQEVEIDAKRRAPVGTPESTRIKGYKGGSLRQSIKLLKKDKLTYKIASNTTGLAPYDIYVEHGTYKMPARPFLYPAFFAGRKRLIKDLKSLLNSTFRKI